VRNPANGQASPMVSIESSGIIIPKIAMVRGTGLKPPGVFEGLVAESMPLEVRGQQAEFNIKDVGQSSAEPGSENTITVTFSSTVPLTYSNPVSVITISGFAGADASLGAGDFAISIVDEEKTPPPAPCPTPKKMRPTMASPKEHFAFEWDNVKKSIKLTPLVSDTSVGALYVLTVKMTNPDAGQQSPSIFIESSGIVIQPAALHAAKHALGTMDDQDVATEAPAGSAAPLYVLPPRLIKRTVRQDFCGAVLQTSAYPGDKNCITFSFTPTVDIKPANNAIVLYGLKGAVNTDGPVSIRGKSAAKFSGCKLTNADDCIAVRHGTGKEDKEDKNHRIKGGNGQHSGGNDEQHHGTGLWNSARSTLSLNVLATLTAFTEVTASFDFTNPMQGQDPPVIQVGMLSQSAPTFNISPQTLLLDTIANED
jgi:hypothetical protein